MNLALPSPESLVARVLTFLASDEERLERFLIYTGLEPDDIRGVSKSPVFFEVVLDYILEDEELRKLFVFATLIDAETLALVRMTANPLPKTREEQGRTQPERLSAAGLPGIARQFTVVSEKDPVL